MDVCGFSFTNAGVALVMGQTPGDCNKLVCDGAGNAGNVPDDDPSSDSNDCTTDTCSNGMNVHTPLTDTPCNGGSGICNAGACVACNVPANCAGSDTLCQQRTCDNHVCGVFNVPNDGTPIGPQTTGDCMKNVCDGAGHITSANDDADVPADDGNLCTTETCSGGVPAHPPVANGTVMGPQTPNDCKSKVCDGAGSLVTVDDDSDVPVDDGNQCTSEACSSGVPAHPAKVDGTVCTSAQGGRCEASTCTPTFMVVRIGNGSGGLTSAAQAIFLERRYLDTVGGLVDTINMPIALNGAQKPLTMSGTASSEGALSLSQDGQYVTLAGYGVIPGTLGVKGLTTSVANRVVGRVDGSGNIDTSTAFTTNAALSSDNVRGATSVDGTRFWAAGAGSGSTGGVWAIDFAATSGAQVLTTPKSPKVVHIFLSQLYGSASGNNPSLYTVGSGLPTTLTTATVLNGLPTNMGQSFFSFVFFDLDSGVAGYDTLYIADENAISGTPATSGGIQKWKFNGTSWSLDTTITNGLDTTTNGVRGLAGWKVGNTVMLVATTALDQDALAAPAPNKLVLYQDDNVNPVLQTVLSTAATNTVYRGVAIAP
jgi:hypothetical protein